MRPKIFWFDCPFGVLAMRLAARGWDTLLGGWHSKQIQLHKGDTRIFLLVMRVAVIEAADADALAETLRELAEVAA